MTEALLKDFGRSIASLRLIPSGGGRFELSINGELIFSKAQTGRFPEADEIRRQVRGRLV